MQANLTPPWNRKEREMTPRKLNNSLLFLQIYSSIFSFFSYIGKEVEEWWEIMWEDVGCTGATAPAL
jgi:hypothetical protein